MCVKIIETLIDKIVIIIYPKNYYELTTTNKILQTIIEKNKIVVVFKDIELTHQNSSFSHIINLLEYIKYLINYVVKMNIKVHTLKLLRC